MINFLPFRCYFCFLTVIKSPNTKKNQQNLCGAFTLLLCCFFIIYLTRFPFHVRFALLCIPLTQKSTRRLMILSKKQNQQSKQQQTAQNLRIPERGNSKANALRLTLPQALALASLSLLLVLCFDFVSLFSPTAIK